MSLLSAVEFLRIRAFRILLVVATVSLIGCATQPLPPQNSQNPPRPEATAPSVQTRPIFNKGNNRLLKNRASIAPEAIIAGEPKYHERRGLATAFGESLTSPADYTDFKRGFLAKPFAVGVLYYNDAPGSSAMANYLGTPIPLKGGLITTAKGVVDWGLESFYGRQLGGFLVDGKVILRGDSGDRYSVLLRNNTRQPLEFVVSVDGLDVIDGEPAAYSKRGYIVGPKRTLEVKGFRTSTENVAAFRFGKVSDSYAVLRHDDPRNVGVIGVAVFSENGKNPWVVPNQRPRRDDAKPFPAQRFAIPPH